ncbi:hypothetical protein ATY77_26615 [Rhizobium sp. R634]|uniref:hypothetical protein n=1 Tax=Rhizobium sp. R634 TaxID=1764274 RepID=UPI000B52A576|nr:hypothetical protein [Rhizobium sp. R634]OWV79564.1 hypothetical protein ATY77_26615 [Rhizobium sp. R634]
MADHAYIATGSQSKDATVFPSIIEAVPQDINQFAGLFDALSACAEFCLGVMAQPRFETNGQVNAAGTYLDILSDALKRERSLLIEKLLDFKPATAGEADLQYRLLVRFEAEEAELGFEQLIDILRRGQAAVASAR